MNASDFRGISGINLPLSSQFLESHLYAFLIIRRNGVIYSHITHGMCLADIAHVLY